MIERRVKCPQCRNEIRLTEAELADKRGFCALCDARFDLLPDMFVGDGPLREVPVARALLAVGPPPSRRLRVESPAPGAPILLRPSRWLALPLLGFSAVWWGFLIFWYTKALQTNNMLMKLFPLVHVAAGIFVLWRVVWTLLGWERIAVVGSRLEVTRGLTGATTSVRGTEADGSLRLEVRESRSGGRHSDSRTTLHLSVISAREPLLKIGNGIGLDADDMAWLKAALTQRLAAARG